MVALDHLTTESRNPHTIDLDELGVEELLTVMNEEDQRVPAAVRTAIPQIADAVRLVVDAFRRGGRLVYLGAGTSGRLGVLDAAECPPTFGTDPGQVVGVIAGGMAALTQAIEGAEDSAEAARADLAELGLTGNDVVVGIAASGRTPYVVAGLDAATAVGAGTVAISCNRNSLIGRHASVVIEIDNGPEILTGSTRLKSGTSQKLVLNMISTAAMVGTGKVFGNLMVDVRATNEKLVVRARRIVATATGCDDATAAAAYAAADGSAKTAIVMILADCSRDEAQERLRRSDGFVRTALAQTL